MSPEVQTLMSGFRVQGLGFRSLRVPCSTHFTIYFIVIIGNITYSLGFLMALTANSLPQLCQQAFSGPTMPFFYLCSFVREAHVEPRVTPAHSFSGQSILLRKYELVLIWMVEKGATRSYI